MITKNDKKAIVSAILNRAPSRAATYVNNPESVNGVTKAEIDEVAAEFGHKLSYSFLKNARVSHGVYDISALARKLGVSDIDLNAAADTTAAPAPAADAANTTVNSTVNSTVNYEVSRPSEAPTELRQRVMARSESDIIPKKDPLYVRTPNYKHINTVVKSLQFYPIFITGQSGNGKSLSVIQACASAKRELIRINVTAGTDEEDLIGSFRLVAGETVWQDGPVTEAMKRGAVLLIDEIDMLHPNKAASLFTVLEGKGLFIKKINTLVEPSNGFTVIATGNTKGKGSEDGRFIGTNVLNEAFLERFPITLEFSYPTEKSEMKILTKAAKSLGVDMSDGENVKVIDALTTWSKGIRSQFEEESVDETMSTRRLVHIIKAWSMFGKISTAIELTINRFDDDTKTAFLDFWNKIYEVTEKSAGESGESDTNTEDESDEDEVDF